VLAPVVEQDLADFLPDRVRTVELDRIQALDLDGAEASQALDPKELARDFGKAPLADVNPWPPGGARVAENGVPVAVR
jgi:hypothetical protein